MSYNIDINDNMSNLYRVPTGNDFKKHMDANLLKKFNEQVVNDLITYLQPYYTKIDKLEPLYAEADTFIEEINDFLVAENDKLMHCQKLADEHYMNKNNMYTYYIFSIETTMDAYEDKRSELRNKLRAITRTFPDASDTYEHDQKINWLCSEFLEFHIAMSTIENDYREIVKNIA